MTEDGTAFYMVAMLVVSHPSMSMAVCCDNLPVSRHGPTTITCPKILRKSTVQSRQDAHFITKLQEMPTGFVPYQCPLLIGYRTYRKTRVS
jgi:hypothetical protein